MTCAFDAVLEVFNVLKVKVANLETAITYGQGIVGLKFILQSKMAKTVKDLAVLQREMQIVCQRLDKSYSIGEFYHPAHILDHLFYFKQLNNNVQKEVDFLTSHFYHQWEAKLTCPNNKCPFYGIERTVAPYRKVNAKLFDFVFGLYNEYPSATMLDATFSLCCDACKQRSKLPLGRKQLTSFPKVLVCLVHPDCVTGYKAPPLETRTAGITYNLVGAIVRKPAHFYCIVKYHDQWMQIDNVNSSPSYLESNTILDLAEKRGWSYELLFYIRQ